MSQWKEYKLKDFANVQTGPFGSQLHAHDYVLKGIPSIMPTNISNRLNIVLDKIAYVSEVDIERLKKYKVKEGDIVYARRGDVEKCAFITEKENGWLCGTGCLRIRFHSNQIEPKFCAYYFSTPDIKAWVLSNAVGTTMPNLNSSTLEDLPLLLPPLSEQKAISSILSSLDAKIDLLHSNNTTLEKYCETVFRQWFVEDIEGDELISLGKYVDCINGYSYKSSELNPSKNALATLKNFDRDGGFRLDGFKEFTGKINKHQIVQEGDLVVAHTDITQDAEVVGNPVLIVGDPRYETIVISMDLVKVVPKEAWLSKEFLYFLMKHREFKYHCLGHANGTTVLHLEKIAIPTFEFRMPEKEKIKEYTDLVRPMIEKNFENHRQLKSLTSTRETFLLKLMSGEARVKM